MPEELIGRATIGATETMYGRAGSGPGVVLIHAGIADRSMWDPQLAEFADAFTTVRYDLRGFGESELGDEEFSYRRDLSALIDALDLGSVFVIACSMGGAVALELAIEEPERVAGLVLVGAGTPGVTPDDGYYEPPEWDEVAAAYRAGDLERAAILEADMWVAGYGRSIADVRVSVRDAVRVMNRGAAASESRRDELEQRPDPGVATRLDEVLCPTLVMVGDRDFPDIVWGADYLAANIAGAGNPVVIPNTAHLPSMEEPALFNAAVLGFLDQHG
jgi:pimeloyl-ACP methyl ester carboxylesterase